MEKPIALLVETYKSAVYLPAAMAARMPFELAYPAIAWLCWVPNLLLAEAMFNRTHDSSRQPTPRVRG